MRKNFDNSVNDLSFLSVSRLDLVFFFFTCLIILVLWLLPSQGLIFNIGVLIGIWISASILFILTRVDYLVALFSPNFICFFYLSGSLVLGCFAVYYEYGVLLNDFINDFRYVNNMKPIITFLVIGLSLNLFIGIRCAKQIDNTDLTLPIVVAPKKSIPIFLLAIYFCTLFESFYTYAVQLVCVMFICFLALNFKMAIRSIIYCSAIIPFTIGFANKRELILVLLVIMFCEALKHRSKISLSFKTVSLVTVACFIFLFFISVMSIMRGYGNFIDTGVVWDAIPYVGTYVTSDFFLSNFADNLEVSHTLPAMILPIEYVIEGRMDLLAGSTLIKPLFLPLPGEIFWFKPESAIRIFTLEQAPEVSAGGGSFPVPFVTEVFMNFHVFGLLVYGAILLIMEKVFKKAITASLLLPKVVYLLLSTYFFVVIRGSGLDLYFLHVFVPIVVILFVGKIYSFVKRNTISGVEFNV